jgi:hypothetical protein
MVTIRRNSDTIFIQDAHIAATSGEVERILAEWQAETYNGPQAYKPEPIDTQIARDLVAVFGGEIVEDTSPRAGSGEFDNEVVY